MRNHHRASRRSILAGMSICAAATGGLACASPVLAKPRKACTRPAEQLVHLPAQTSWTEEPPQAPAREHMIEVDGGRLWAWDTGGEGPPLVLMHAHTGSGATWGYQQPVFAAAGYRVIAYSRRGHFRSSSAPGDSEVAMIDDLERVLHALDIDRFHLIATAAGGFVGFDFALSAPERLLSLTLACTLGGIGEDDFRQTTARLLPEGWQGLPASFRELGPSYRAANPSGTARWQALADSARAEYDRVQPTRNAITWQAIQSVTVPTLLITGQADLYFPPSRLRALLDHMPQAQGAIIAEAGHAAYWEQPDAFNARILGHLGLHSTSWRAAS